MSSAPGLAARTFASACWDQIYSHIKKIIWQWNAIGASACNRMVLAKAFLLSRCSYLIDCNGIPCPMLHKISNSICRFICGCYSNAPFSILSAPLALGGMNCPSLKECKLAHDAKFIGDLISLPLDLPWKDWTHMDLFLTSTNPSRQDSVHLNPLLQLSITKLSSLEPCIRNAFISCHDLCYDISCAFPSLAARRDMPSTYHPALPLHLVQYTNSLHASVASSQSHTSLPLGTSLPVLTPSLWPPVTGTSSACRPSRPLSPPVPVPIPQPPTAHARCFILSDSKSNMPPACP
jgi:hypothetical protein